MIRYPAMKMYRKYNMVPNAASRKNSFPISRADGDKK
jgi:hypothetical protein